eukprot:scaffold14685_cov18-Tisochrysis_lutea.AAC.1
MQQICGSRAALIGHLNAALLPHKLSTLGALMRLLWGTKEKPRCDSFAALVWQEQVGHLCRMHRAPRYGTCAALLRHYGALLQHLSLECCKSLKVHLCGMYRARAKRVIMRHLCSTCAALMEHDAQHA